MWLGLKAPADDGTIFNGQHLLQSPCDSDEQGADAAAHRQGILHILLEKTPKQRPSRAAGHDGGCIDNRSQTVHILSFSFVSEEFYHIFINRTGSGH